jgi:ABC-type branched-subunit amino acid transport system permease subunit
MSGIRFFNVHRIWEDGLSMLAGALIVLSPWIVGPPYPGDIVLNATLVGLVVLSLGQLQYVILQRWEEIAEMAAGLWLIASPFIFSYAGDGMLRYWHFALGALVALLAILELWQDWNRSDQELAHH